MFNFDLLDQENSVTVNAENLSILPSAKAYKQALLEQIKQAKQRIYIAALYLQDDEAGNEILTALYEAKQANPKLDVAVFVDGHRARRGLIGEAEQEGNRACYLKYAEKYEHGIKIFGVAVKNKELFGVLHLKGMVFDDTLFYTGASINDIYLHQHDKYRLDRYYLIKDEALADSFVKYMVQVFMHSGLVPRLNKGEYPELQDLKKLVVQLRKYLTNSHYKIEPHQLNKTSGKDDIQIEPIVGFGRRKNPLNSKIRKLIQKSQQDIVIFTPYFNLPKVLLRDVSKALKRGVNITITIGDKTANDFYISDPEKFSTIGIVPYIYEILLVRFLKRWKKYVDNGQLQIRLWKHESNSYHLKGIIVDQRYHLVTGSNLNPRAWALDLENGLLIDDVNGKLQAPVSAELATIYEHTKVVKSYTELDSIKDYPSKPKKLLAKLRMTQIDKILKRLL